MDDRSRRRLASVLMAARLAPTALMLSLGCAPRYASMPPMTPDELWAPLPVQHTTIEGIDIAYIDSGGDKPPILLVHGLSSWMGFWEYQVPELAKTRRVIALDLPGYGASGRPDAPYTPPWYADILASFMDDRGLSSSVVMGHSMGGQIALTLALDHPSRVDALILSAPAGIERFKPGHASWLKSYWTEDRTLQSSEEEVRYSFVQLAFARSDEGVERLLQERVRMKGTPMLSGTSVAVSRSIAGMLDHPVVERLSNLVLPTLIVYGTDDRMIPNPILNGGRTRTIASQAQKAIAGSELVMIPGAGHTVHHDAPEAFNSAVSAFLARVRR